MPANRVIVGLTGSFGSGCSTVAEILKERGFKVISLSSFLKEEAKNRGINLERLAKKERKKKDSSRYW